MDPFKCGNGVINKQFAPQDRQELSQKVSTIKPLVLRMSFNLFGVNFFYLVTRCRFSQHGNKFGVADGDGKLSLWQVGLASQCNRSFFVSFLYFISDFFVIKNLSIFAVI